MLDGRTALVTGASSGLGVDFARELASRRCGLVLVARREDRLRNVAHELSAEFGISAEAIALDLAEPAAPRQLYERLKAAGTRVDVLVNNAGFGIFGSFAKTPWERQREMLELDIIALVHLTRLFLDDMLARDFGYVLQVASTGAYQPTPTYAVYAAAKSFVLHFGEALAYELRDSAVSCTVVSPGITGTEFQQVAGHTMNRVMSRMSMQSREVARIGIAALLARRSSVVTGRMNALTAWLVRFMPRRLSAAVAYRLMTAR